MKSNRTAVEVSTGAHVWGKLYQRLEIARLGLERSVTPSPETQRRILRERAQALAQVPVSETASQEVCEMVEFLLADATYGIASAYVREVHPLRNCTPLPCTPPFVLGIINVHGRILSVLDLKQLFDLPARGLTDLNQVVIVHNDRMEFGILADAILGVRAIPRQHVHAPPPTLTAAGATYVQGITGDQVVVLDAQKLLSDENIVVHEEVEM